MPLSKTKAQQILGRVLARSSMDEIKAALQPRRPQDDPLPPRVPCGNETSATGLRRRQAFLHERGMAIEALTQADGAPAPETLRGNIENLIGFARLPVGVLGPLRINGLHAHGDFYVPLATTEGAMIASYHRGAYLISQSGGAVAMCLAESITRTPCLHFHDVRESARFLAWLVGRTDGFQAIVDQTSRHCEFQDMHMAVNGKEVHLIFEFTTGDAAGQNMITVATEAICRRMIEESPIKPLDWLLEGNLSGDKKATMIAFTSTRGKMVVAETIIPQRLVRRILHVAPARLVQTANVSLRGGVQSGSIGAQGHYANALAALFLACGQDVACVAESSVGMTTMDLTPTGDLYVSVNLPNLMVGTVGGGTHLPTARECLAMLGCRGEGTARKFAEICAVTAMAGEISIMGAMAAGEFGKAHATYRHKPGKGD
jgi:hydroxymethylglutaryl-CoA reductase (NADPH)